MEAVFLVCGARGPQLKRDPLYSGGHHDKGFVVVGARATTSEHIGPVRAGAHQVPAAGSRRSREAGILPRGLHGRRCLTRSSSWRRTAWQNSVCAPLYIVLNSELRRAHWASRRSLSAIRYTAAATMTKALWSSGARATASQPKIVCPIGAHDHHAVGFRGVKGSRLRASR